MDESMECPGEVANADYTRKVRVKRLLWHPTAPGLIASSPVNSGPFFLFDEVFNFL
jgi:hypothetical protein